MAYGSPDIPPSEAQGWLVGDQPLACLVCKGDRFWTRTQQLETGGWFQPRARWTDPAATLVICVRCGHVHWFAPR